MENIKKLIADCAEAQFSFELAENDQLKINFEEAIPELIQRIKDNKEGILYYLRSDGYKKVVKATQTDQKHNLSYAQQRLWFIDNLKGSTQEYNMPMAFDVTGELNIAVLKKAFHTIIARHEILRTTYHEHDGLAVQQLKGIDAFAFDIQEVDLTNLSGDSLQTALKGHIDELIGQPFDLSQDLMLRVSYIKRTNDSGVLLFNMHHIASDGWSMEVILKELFTLYHSYIAGMPNPLPALSIQYSDYALWQKQYLSNGVLEQQLAYWEKQLDDLPVVHSLPLDKPRTEGTASRVGIVHGQLSSALAKELINIAKMYQLTPFMLLHGMLSLLLAKHSNSNDIVIGTPIANRLQSELEPLIGFFANTLVLRADTSFVAMDEYFAHIRALHLDAQSNQDVPFEQLVERLKIPRSQSHSPLFQVLLTTNSDYALTPGSEQAFKLPNVELQTYQSDYIHAKFDLDIDISISDSGVALVWEYDTSIFMEQRIQVLNDHFCKLLNGLACMVAEGNNDLPSLPMLSQEEAHYLLNEVNDTVVPYAKDMCIHELIEEQASLHPERAAVVFDDEVLSYAELNRRANQVAHYLREEHHIKPDDIVGLCAERSVEMVVGIVAILKAGGAYLPLDPSYPVSRLSYMVEDAALRVVLTQGSNIEIAERLGTPAVALDKHAQFSTYDITNGPKSQLGLTANHLAYVIYTSGSTGKPKGVMVEHQALFNRIHWMHNKYGMTHRDNVLQKTPYSFDVSVWEFVWTLAYGAKLVVARPDGHKDPEYLCRLIQQSQITKLHFVPSMLGLILENKQFSHCHSLEQVFCSGEALQQSHVEEFRKVLPSTQLHNLYGPTEAAIDVSYWDCSGDISKGVPIGKPIDNIQLLILDPNLNLVPKGSVGELHIGGDGLARGYLNQEQLTSERFIHNPFYDEGQGSCSPRLYKTGDLARLRADGEIEYQGRIDHQVKIRGLRIELGEVEHQLSGLHSVDSALVLAKEVAGSTQLVGYFKPSHNHGGFDQKNLIENIQKELNGDLPAHMVPSILIAIDEWPLTANGKVDRKALPEPEGSALQGEYVAPVTEVEQKLVDIWSALLNIPSDTISTTANFFTLGGHSLLSIRLMSEIRQQFAVALPVQAVFDAENLAALATRINQSQGSDMRPAVEAVARTSSIQPVSFAQRRLWFIDQLQGGSAEDIMP
ncbi:non-ribosomal peptide synthetase, partial [Pseudoalteromonas sp. S2755]|uniref:non-ribosomal peptide synthetase n=1 Tax=Pseudoalteromonas sp. S2755 TaxID=2066523 RepID=UPI00110B6108